MGKRIIAQRKGRGTGIFRVPSHRYKADVKYEIQEECRGIIEDIIHDPGHTAPLAKIKLENGKETYLIATEGLTVGDTIKFTSEKDFKIGNVLPLGSIPEGFVICNIEVSPGDGGKLVRSSGGYATIISHDKDKTVVKLPSGKFKTLNSACRATIGIVAGAGRTDKPFVKAGTKHIAMRARGRLHPIVRGVAMNPVSHPHGGGSHQHVGKPKTVKRGAPPGRKVGSIASKRTGKR
jgi:large subunit ribosomal protein L2